MDVLEEGASNEPPHSMFLLANPLSLTIPQSSLMTLSPTLKNRNQRFVASNIGI